MALAPHASGDKGAQVPKRAASYLSLSRQMEFVVLAHSCSPAGYASDSSLPSLRWKTQTRVLE